MRIDSIATGVSRMVRKLSSVSPEKSSLPLQNFDSDTMMMARNGSTTATSAYSPIHIGAVFDVRTSVPAPLPTSVTKRSWLDSSMRCTSTTTMPAISSGEASAAATPWSIGDSDVNL